MKYAIFNSLQPEVFAVKFSLKEIYSFFRH